MLYSPVNYFLTLSIEQREDNGHPLPKLILSLVWKTKTKKKPPTHQ